MRVSSLVKNALVSGDFSGCFSTFPPSAAEHPECVVVLEDAFERESRIEGEERGRVQVSVFVVRELPAEAESVAIAAERCIRGASWEPFAESGPWRIAGIDTTAPAFRERDSSGRFVWEFAVTVTVVRSI